MTKIITAEQAAALVKDNTTIAVGGMGLAGWPEAIAQALEKRFLETGAPRNITVRQGSAIGDWKERGMTRWGHEGLLKRWVGAHIGASPGLAQLSADNKVEAYCLPQGVLVNLWREIAAKRAGLITKVGLGTFVDPRVEGGKMNAVTKDDETIVKVVEFEGEEYLFYKSFPIDVAMIRGTTVDENGNLTQDNESFIAEILPIAQAAKNSGGIVIVQAQYLAKTGTLHPKNVRVPGILVDYIVVTDKEDCIWQTEGTVYNPAFAGHVKVPLEAIPKLPMNERKIISRRAAMELTQGAVVNLGYGMPVDIASVAAEEGVTELMTLTTESGGVGGVPASPPNFGAVYNAEASLQHNAMFDFYDGGGLDVAFLGLAQTDRFGNVNVSKFGRPIGCGGFINITQTSKKVVYTGTFTAGKLQISVSDGKLRIEQEGKNRKFLEHVEQITFSGKYAAQVKQPVLYITERAVFSLIDGDMVLVEIAPGMDIEKDVFGQMGFKPKVSPNLKLMPAEIFAPEWGGLRALMPCK